MPTQPQDRCAPPSSARPALACGTRNTPFRNTAGRRTTPTAGCCGHLKCGAGFRPYDSRKLQLQQCPSVGTYYLYTTDIVMRTLVNGSEDEEKLTRRRRSKPLNNLGSVGGGAGVLRCKPPPALLAYTR